MLSEQNFSSNDFDANWSFKTELFCGKPLASTFQAWIIFCQITFYFHFCQITFHFHFLDFSKQVIMFAGNLNLKRDCSGKPPASSLDDVLAKNFFLKNVRF